MDETDEGLRRLLALDEPPERDIGFELGVAAQIARRRVRRAAVDWIVAGAAAAALLWAVGPWLLAVGQALFTALDGAAPVIVATAFIAAALLLTWLLPGRFELSPPADY